MAMHLTRFFPLAISLLLLALSPPATLHQCTAQGSSPYKPLVSHLARDPATSLYTISIQDSGPLVVDLAGPLLWSTCRPKHPTFPCGSDECTAANNSGPLASSQAPSSESCECTCTARPCNPVTGACAAGDLTRSAMSANATDGRSLLGYTVSFTSVTSCAPDALLDSLPAGAVGVAGLSRAPLSLPSQLSYALGSSRFALCLPGVAVFGDTPIYLSGFPLELTGVIASTPLLRNPKNRDAYYVPVVAISVFWTTAGAAADVSAALPPRALEMDTATGRGGVTLSTVARYTALRSDVYRAVLQAYDASVRKAPPGYAVTKVEPPAGSPFEVCYDAWTLRPTKRTGWDVPTIRLELAAGASSNWTINSGNSLVQVADRTVCLAFVDMGREDGPAAVIGTYQLEDNLLVFDAGKDVLRFSGLLWGSGATCSSFNFTS
ncbi:hypothetical protein BRADI_2g27290v3 [Brachypodium distachyon]|uniref:Peptidase A1 domain-containing protein n=2 Tax=Brachypodium distachyon TaxID=15368 RepID=I1HK27_BRADI|nr:hypothetical protein BRADI_2g27290v3 [Brachypodium distachyon]